MDPNAEKRRLSGLVRIGVDETSYRKGHKYITVVVNHDTGEVVWVHDGHGKSVFELFFKQLTPGLPGCYILKQVAFAVTIESILKRCAIKYIS